MRRPRARQNDGTQAAIRAMLSRRRNVAVTLAAQAGVSPPAAPEPIAAPADSRPVLISCNPSDIAVAEKLANDFGGRYGIPCDLPERRRLAGDDPARIGEMIGACRALVVLQTPGGQFDGVVWGDVVIARATYIPIVVFRAAGEIQNSFFFAEQVDGTDWHQGVEELGRVLTPSVSGFQPDPALNPLSAGAELALGPLTLRDEAIVVDPLTTGNPVIDQPTKKPRRKRTPKSVEQRPAAYRFTSTGDKIDVLPELPEALDRQLAADTQQELVAKARELLARLQGSNSARRVCDSVQRLIEALDVPFDDLRPGICLSRVRSLEADRTAFDTDEAHAELFPDAFARVDDTVQTARDLLAVFPDVRRIEAERLALDLDRQPNALPAIEQQIDEIQRAAAQSGAATEGATLALAQNDTAIEAATNPVLRNSLIADKLLVAGNFARAATAKALAELGELGATSWGALKENLPIGIATAARVAPLMALAALTAHIAGPAAGVAAALPTWKPFSRILKKLVGDETKNGQNNRRKGKSNKVTKTPEAILNEITSFLEKPENAISNVFVIEVIPYPPQGSWKVAFNGKYMFMVPIEDQKEFQPLDNLARLQKFYERLQTRYIVDWREMVATRRIGEVTEPSLRVEPPS